MDGFVAPVGELRRAGDAAARVHAAVRTLDLGPVAHALACALPGGALAVAGGEIARRWSGSVSAAADRMQAHADGFASTAAAYVEADERAARRLTAR